MGGRPSKLGSQPNQDTPNSDAKRSQETSTKSLEHSGASGIGAGYGLAAQRALAGGFGAAAEGGVEGAGHSLHFKPSRSMADVHKVASLASFGGDEAKAQQYEIKNQKNLSEARASLKKVQSRDDFARQYHNRELAAAAIKRVMAADWLPEYQPVSIVPPNQSELTVLQRQTRVSPAMIVKVN